MHVECSLMYQMNRQINGFQNMCDMLYAKIDHLARKIDSCKKQQLFSILRRACLFVCLSLSFSVYLSLYLSFLSWLWLLWHFPKVAARHGTPFGFYKTNPPIINPKFCGCVKKGKYQVCAVYYIPCCSICLKENSWDQKYRSEVDIVKF